MKAASTALVDLLLTGAFAQTDLYTFALVGGGIIRLTTLDRDVTVSGQTWISSGPYLDASNGGSRAQKATSHQKVGLDVDTWTFAVAPRAVNPFTGAAYPDRIGSQPWLAAVAAGALDGATVQVDRAYWASWPQAPAPLGAPVGVVSALFAGRVAQIQIDRGIAIISLNSHLELLTQQVPRNFYGPSCNHTLFDTACTLSAAAFAVGGTVSAVTTQSQIVSTIAAPSGSGTYALGRVAFTSGQNTGFSRMVRSWNATTGLFQLLSPLPFPAQVGDAFTGYPGCDKAQATCKKFANFANFGGMPFIPPIETAV